MSVLTVEPGPIDALPPIEYRTPIEARATPPAVDCLVLNVDIVVLIVRRFFASEAKIDGQIDVGDRLFHLVKWGASS